MEVKNSVLAEHGFSALVSVSAGDAVRSILFDFGFSAHGAAFNARALNLDLSDVEATVLSHGHLDHVGGIAELSGLIGKKGTPLVLHPEAFRNPRYIKFSEEFKVKFPPLTRKQVTDAGLTATETTTPYGLLDDAVLFLGEVPRKTDFETGAPNFFYEKDGNETWDDLADDSAIVMNVRGQGARGHLGMRPLGHCQYRHLRPAGDGGRYGVCHYGRLSPLRPGDGTSRRKDDEGPEAIQTGLRHPDPLHRQVRNRGD